MAELKAIDGTPIEREKPKRDETIADLLEKLTQMNNEGKLRAFAYVRCGHDGGFSTNWSYLPNPLAASGLIGAVSMLHSDLIESVKKLSGEREDRGNGPSAS